MAQLPAVQTLAACGMAPHDVQLGSLQPFAGSSSGVQMPAHDFSLPAQPPPIPPCPPTPLEVEELEEDVELLEELVLDEPPIPPWPPTPLEVEELEEDVELLEELVLDELLDEPVWPPFPEPDDELIEQSNSSQASFVPLVGRTQPM